MIICKWPDPLDDHLQEAGASGWSIVRGLILQMIICNNNNDNDNDNQNNNDSNININGGDGVTGVTGQKEEKKEKEREEEKFLRNETVRTNWR